MKKYKPYLFSAILIALMLWASSCKSIDEGIRYASSTGCCSYTVYEDDCLQYESDGYHTTICWDNKVTREQSIEEIHEHCYDNHYQKQ
jgi:hypothetical protein